MQNTIKQKRIITFIVLLVGYFFINLLTSDATAGMSGRMHSGHNLFNQLAMSCIIAYMIYVVFFIQERNKTSTEKYAYFFSIYIIIRQLIFFFEKEYLFYSNLTVVFWILFWSIGFIFCMMQFKLTDNTKIDKYLMILIVSYLFFVTYRTITQKAILEEADILSGINVAGSVYMIVPLILLVAKDKWKMILLTYCFALAVFSAKRQAVVGMSIVTIFAFHDVITAFFRRNKRNSLICLFIILVGLYIYRDSVIRIADDLNARNEQFEENGQDADNGRKLLRDAAMIGFFNAHPIKQLLGGGSGQDKRYIQQTIFNPRYTHNGFIQILCDYGFVTLCVFILLLLSIVFISRKFNDKRDRYIGYSIFASFIFCNSISHVSNMNFIFLAIAFGYLYNKNTYKRIIDTYDTKKNNEDNRNT